MLLNGCFWTLDMTAWRLCPVYSKSYACLKWIADARRHSKQPIKSGSTSFQEANAVVSKHCALYTWRLNKTDQMYYD